MAAPGGNGGVLERAGLALIVLLGGAACNDAPSRRAYAVPGEGGDRITVEVLNATRRGGLARTATREAVQGVATPPLRDLFASLVEHRVPVYV